MAPKPPLATILPSAFVEYPEKVAAPAMNRGVLVKFIASARNCRCSLSLMATVLKRDTSKFTCPGARSEIVRETLPKVKAGANENAAGLIY